MSALETAIAGAKARKSRVVMPEMEDDRIAQAAEHLRADGICVPVALGDNTEAYVSALMAARGVKEAVARRMVARPLYRAAAMVAVGEADAMVAGAVASTKKVIEAASIGIGLDDGVTVPSSFFLMRFPSGREVIFADCGLNVDPDAEALAAIAQASERSGRTLLGTARVALLSFSTGASGSGASVDKVRAAAEITGFVGPVQGDAALNPTVAEKKGLGAGDANVLVFPSLDAGNIAYKLAQELAGAQALGPILQGFRKPVCDLSRGATVQDIVDATAVTLALA
ncbi:phosphate acetyltransferase [Shimia sp. R11_0]|uniref:phosphate acyltransferase n=1 Tax=Shimia sp. R11_0 TaxID=2821096 RepID=UPI001ADC75B6|nr:phosphate acyltransferase [Shimia sp. R11_0]MBO9476446.1 phosphate acetyltransferase [Shimia sp. R11_0]